MMSVTFLLKIQSVIMTCDIMLSAILLNVIKLIVSTPVVESQGGLMYGREHYQLSLVSTVDEVKLTFFSKPPGVNVTKLFSFITDDEA